MVTPNSSLFLTLISAHHRSYWCQVYLSHPSTALSAHCHFRSPSPSSLSLAWTSAKICQQVFPFPPQTSVFPVLYTSARGIFPEWKRDWSCLTCRLKLSSGHPLMVAYGWHCSPCPVKLCLWASGSLRTRLVPLLSLTLLQPCWHLSVKLLPVSMCWNTFSLSPCVVGTHSFSLVCSTVSLFSVTHSCDQVKSYLTNGSQPKCHLRSVFFLALSLNQTPPSILSLSNLQFFAAFVTFLVVYVFVWLII